MVEKREKGPQIDKLKCASQSRPRASTADSEILTGTAIHNPLAGRTLAQCCVLLLEALVARLADAGGKGRLHATLGKLED
jgi:hypothetical protein